MAKDASLTKEAAKAKKANEKNSKKAALSKKPKKSIVKYFKDLKSEFKIKTFFMILFKACLNFALM